MAGHSFNRLPVPPPDVVATFLHHMEAAEAARTKAREEAEAATEGLTAALSLNREDASIILGAFKPPK